MSVSKLPSGKWRAQEEVKTGHGLCECGCGEKTKIAQKTYTASGARKGEPNAFLKGHHVRLRPKQIDYLVEDRGFTSPCWVWQRHVNEEGYGRLRPGGRYGRAVLAHRHYYELFVGPIPEGLVIDHLCRVRCCVNTEHLEPVTARENILRGEGRGARFARRTHCDNGHEYTPENTYMRTKHCRKCIRCQLAERKAA